MADRTQQRDRGLDWLSLVAGIATLLVSAYVLGDGPEWLSGFDLRWVLAGGAALIGVGLLASSLRSK